MNKHLGPGRVRLHAFRPGVPPTEIRLWALGDNSTDYGVHKWTDRSVAEVCGDYERRGNPLQIDVEHNNAEGPKSADDIGPTGGYAKLEIRNREPWLVFDWSAFAVEQIATRQRLFLSPEYDVDRETGEIIRLVRVSLVADPGTHNARMLASRRLAGRTRSMDMKLFLAALKAALKAKDPGEAVGALISEVEGAVGDEAEPASESPEALAKKAAAECDAPAKDPKEAKKAAADPAAEDKSKEPMQAADGMAQGEEKKDEGMAAKKMAMKASAPSAEEKALALRVAQLETDKIQREADARYQAASHRIPETLRAYARKVASNEVDFNELLKGLPEIKGAGGVKASAGRTQAEPGNQRAGRLSEEDTVKMSRVFASNAPPETPFTLLPDGGIRATHMFRPNAGVNPQTLVPKAGIKEA